MTELAVPDFDYIAARLHGRYGRISAGERLDPLCRIRSIVGLARLRFPTHVIESSTGFQRQLVTEFAQEVAWISRNTPPRAVPLLDWIRFRLEIENLKIVLRGIVTGKARGAVNKHLLDLPAPRGLDLTAIAEARSLDELCTRLPEGPLRDQLQLATAKYRDQTQPFLFESAVDASYFRELMERVRALPGKDKRMILPMVSQEIDIFHLMLALRARFMWGIKPGLLTPLHVDGTRLNAKQFLEVLDDRDLASALARIVPRLLDRLPTPQSDAAIIESFAWQRLFDIAHRSLRTSHMGFAAIVGYVTLRRMEIANLTTISEGTRMAMQPDLICEHLMPRTQRRRAHDA